MSKRVSLKPVVDRLPEVEAILATEAIKPVGRWEDIEMPGHSSERRFSRYVQ